MANFYKKAQFGRSMVEMLGVLAIIGMLSLGSIAAYSAAMFKYQLNQHAESFGLLLNNAITLLPELRRNYGIGLPDGDNANISKLFADTSLLPAGMHYNPRQRVITDVFKNTFRIGYPHRINTNNGFDSSEYFISIDISRDKNKISSRAKAICRNILAVAKENADSIWAVEMESYFPNGSYSASTFVGGRYSFRNKTKRLVDANLTDFEKTCSACDSERRCILAFWIDVTYNN